jgi:hypothetical protein
MIAKSISSGGGTAAAITYALAKYALDRHGKEISDKLAYAWTVNLPDDLRLAEMAMLATQQMNRTATGNQTYHMVVSFPEGERPESETLKAIVADLAGSIGFGEHQMIAAVHQNTENWHVHVIVNRIHPVSFKSHNPHHDYLTLQRTAFDLERKHGLSGDNHGPSRHRVPELVAAAERAQSWHELHQAFAELGWIIKPRGAGLVIQSAADPRTGFKASSVDRSLGHGPLTKRLGPYLSPEAAPMVERVQRLGRQVKLIQGRFPCEEFAKWREVAMMTNAGEVVALEHPDLVRIVARARPDLVRAGREIGRGARAAVPLSVLELGSRMLAAAEAGGGGGWGGSTCPACGYRICQCKSQRMGLGR